MVTFQLWIFCQDLPFSTIAVRNLVCIVYDLALQIDCKLEPFPADGSDSETNLCPIDRPKTNCTLFLGYTSNIISSGVREIIRYLAEHNMVSYHLSILLV